MGWKYRAAVLQVLDPIHQCCRCWVLQTATGNCTIATGHCTIATGHCTWIGYLTVLAFTLALTAVPLSEAADQLPSSLKASSSCRLNGSVAAADSIAQLQVLTQSLSCSC